MDGQIKRAVELLTARGVHMYVGGCGCCDSPWVYLEIDGEPIVFDSEESPDSEFYRKARDSARISTEGF